MNRYLYYANGGCGNHGCEAIMRSLELILQPSVKSLSLSISPEQDINYGLNDLLDIVSLPSVGRNNLTYLKSYFNLKLLRDKYSLDIYPYRYVLHNLKNDEKIIALSVGGDNYCYGGTDFYYRLDKTFHKSGIKTAMVGCSIEPTVICNTLVKEDLKSHSLIIARESLTFDALQNEGLQNVILLPDPAFTLKTDTFKLREINKLDNIIGINLSPQVNKCSIDGEIITRNIDALIKYIISNTELQIALIPHVVWPQSNDFHNLRPLYAKYSETGRVILIDDCNAEELKGYISRCRMMIAARTHASIAAYSSCVPTLVIGYSVKAKGIAKDIFGTYDKYVLPAQSFYKNTELIDSFEWLWKNEDSIRNHLKSFMPEYCKKPFLIREALENLH